MYVLTVLPVSASTGGNKLLTRWFTVSIMCLAVPLFHGCALLQKPAESPGVTDTMSNSPSVAVKPSKDKESSAGPSRPASLTTKEKPSSELPQTGEASWYGPKFHGKTTASGDTFNQQSFTAAHPTLPFGSKVKVTNLANGKSVEVEINDRGPLAENRIIDVSRAAATILEMKESGTTTVRLELVSGQ